MKMLLLLALTFGLAAQQTGTVTFTWDPMPMSQSWQFVRIYERIGASAPYTYALKAEVSGAVSTATVSNVTPGIHTYIARSVDDWESIDSNSAVTKGQPQPPGQFKKTVTVIIQIP